MIDLKLIRSNPELVRSGAKKKKVDVDTDAILKIDEQHREVLQQLEALRAEQNKLSKYKNFLKFINIQYHSSLYAV